MADKFVKKIYDAKTFFKDMIFFLKNIKNIFAANKNDKINKKFIEKIMTVTTAVNGCVYCEWFHAREAVKAGIDEKEVKNMLNLQFEASATDFELPALLYAQHYAETDRNPDSEMKEKFYNFYGEKTANHIFIFMRMIYFGNLLGNTWDGVISRLKGKPAEDSSILFELFFFLLTFWFMAPAMILTK